MHVYIYIDMCIHTEILPIMGIPVLTNQDCMGWDRMWAQKTTTRRLDICDQGSDRTRCFCGSVGGFLLGAKQVLLPQVRPGPYLKVGN